jgi:hypothetical protein
MQVHDLQVNKALGDTFNPGSSKTFNIQDYKADEEQIHNNAKLVPDVWTFKGNLEQPLSMVKTQFGRAVSDKELYNQQNKTRDLEKLNIGVMLEIAKGEPERALEKAIEVQGALFSLEAAQIWKG